MASPDEYFLTQEKRAQFQDAIAPRDPHQQEVRARPIGFKPFYCDQSSRKKISLLVKPSFCFQSEVSIGQASRHLLRRTVDRPGLQMAHSKL